MSALTRRFTAAAVAITASLGLTVSAAGPASAAIRCADIGQRLNVGDILGPGRCIYSTNRSYVLVMQTDGNLVIYRLSDSRAVFNSGTSGYGAVQARVVRGAWGPDMIVESTDRFPFQRWEGHQGTYVNPGNDGHLYIGNACLIRFKLYCKW